MTKFFYANKVCESLQEENHMLMNKMNEIRSSEDA